MSEQEERRGSGCCWGVFGLILTPLLMGALPPLCAVPLIFAGFLVLLAYEWPDSTRLALVWLGWTALLVTLLTMFAYAQNLVRMQDSRAYLWSWAPTALAFFVVTSIAAVWLYYRFKLRRDAGKEA
jgi:drug/metabolite transporter (DMT)-like permease